MGKKLLLDEAKAFFGISEPFDLAEVKELYHKLAKKFHPDTGEYTSDILFLELNRHYEVLKNHLSDHHELNEIHSGQGNHSKDKVFQLYKENKQKETEVILEYYESRTNLPIQLSDSENQDLVKLRKALEPIVITYLKILENNPESIWIPDIKDSIQRLKVWYEA